MREPMGFKEFKFSELSDDQVRTIYDSMYHDFVLVRGEYLRRRLHRIPPTVEVVKTIAPKKPKLRRSSIRLVGEVL